MQQPIYREISLRPQTAQFFIDELPLLLLCPVGLVYGGMENAPLASIATLLAVLLSLILIYRLIYLKRIRYHVGSEQLTAEHGVFQRSIGYIELYRVVDFHEQPITADFRAKDCHGVVYGQDHAQAGIDRSAQTNQYRGYYQRACRV